MSQPVAIGRFYSHFHTTSDDLPRAQAIQQSLVDELLAMRLQALAPDDELLLIKRIALPLTLSAQHTDWESAQRWCEAIARAVEQAMQAGHVDQLVCFAHPGAALVAFADAVFNQHDTLDWAWQRLGWLTQGAVSASKRRAALFDLLWGQPAWVVPLLKHWLCQLTLQSRLQALTADERARLWQHLLSAYGLTEIPDWPQLVCALRQAVAAAGTEPPIWLAMTDRPEEVASSTRSTGLLSLASTWLAQLRTVPADEAMQWLAWYAVLAQPEWVRRQGHDLPGLLQASLIHGQATMSAQAAPTMTQRDMPAAVADQREPLPTSGEFATPLVESAIEPIQPTLAHTEFGGLLLIAPHLAEAGVMAGLAALPDIPLPTLLTQLARQMLPMMPRNDPAERVFAGLPLLTDDSCNPIELPASAQAVLHTSLQWLHGWLEARLPDWAGAGLIERIARRPASLRLDPGWVDVCFSLDDVSTDIRKAGLDLDPGFVPWLGAVLRYRYA